MITINGGIYLISKEVFVGALHDLHKFIYSSSIRFTDSHSQELTMNLVDGYLMLLGNLDKTIAQEIQKYLLTHPAFDPEGAADLYILLFAEKTKYKS